MRKSPISTCPACESTIEEGDKPIFNHARKCVKWEPFFGVPYDSFPYSRTDWANYQVGCVEGVDYLRCQVCLSGGVETRKRILVSHLRGHHNMTPEEYLRRYPGHKTKLDAILERRKASVKEHYGVEFVAQVPEVKSKARATMLEKYGVEHVLQSPELAARIRQTSLERYGSENPFGSPIIQERIRQVHLQRRGVDSPQKDPNVVAKRLATERERYGDIVVRTDAFKRKVRETCLERYGADSHMKSELGLRRYKEAIQSKYGKDWIFQVESVKAKAYETNLANHGGKHSQKCDDVLSKARVTWMEKHGVDNPSKSESVWQKIRETWLSKYGVPFPPQSMVGNQEHSCPNKLEQRLDSLSPVNVVFSGDGSYWIRTPKGRNRNPDFVVLSPEQMEFHRQGAKLNDLRTTSVIECLGDFWHGPKITGMDRGSHMREVIGDYKSLGIRCLLLWENDINKRPDWVAEKMLRFLSLR